VYLVGEKEEKTLMLGECVSVHALVCLSASLSAATQAKLMKRERELEKVPGDQ
jgi:hypothetical protein